MNLKYALILIAIILNVSLITSKQHQQQQQQQQRSRHQQQQQFDDDEFSEFDKMDEDLDASFKKTPKKQEQQTVDSSSKPSASDFSSFDDSDIVQEEEELDEDFVKNKQKINQAPTTEQKEKSKPQTDNNKKPKQQQQPTFNNQDDLDMEEFEHFVDEEEFEGIGIDSSSSSSKSQAKPINSDKSSTSGSKKDSSNSMPNLKIANVPMHLMSNGNWQNYVWEIVMLVIIGIYFFNFIYGKTKNHRLVQAWYQSNRDLLERNFALVGDDGSSAELPNKEDQQLPAGTLIKESENSYGLWCTGRQMCDGMLVQVKLIKRQDLINGVLMQLIKPQSDQIIMSVEFSSNDDLDNFVFCLCNKKISQQLFNDYQDLSSYCVEKKTMPASSSNNSLLSADYKYADLLNSTVASKYVMLNEIGEIPNCIFDMRVCAFLNKYPDLIEYLLISDQYVGYKASTSEESSSSASSSAPGTSSATANGATPSTPSSSDSITVNAQLGLAKSRPILILCLNIPGKGLNTSVEDMERMQPALQLVMHLIDKVPRIRLSKEAKSKAIKKRKEVAEFYMKQTHKQRQEAAMLRKEEKRRAEKEKIMNESDPEKQKKLEEKEIKREKRKQLSKMKQVKIKSM